LQTWPRVEGSAEYVDGELIYMPPSGDLQHDTCADVVGVLMEWRRRQPGFRVGTNEAGMMLGGDVRAGELSLAPGDRIPADPNLPGLEPQLADLFSQIDE
jgi:Uma2 family endonuclease